jgi:hypothetical protein
VSSPGGDEVGRVSVRVLPDTSKFASEAAPRAGGPARPRGRRQGQPRHRGPARQLEEIRDITIDVKFNVENLQDDINRATAGAQAGPVEVPVSTRPRPQAAVEVAAGLGDNSTRSRSRPPSTRPGCEAEIPGSRPSWRSWTTSEEASPEVILESPNLKAELREVKAELAALSAEKIDIKVEDSGSPRSLAEVRRGRVDLDAIAVTRSSFKLELEEKRLQGELTKVLAELEALDGETATPEVDARVAAAMADLAKVLAALEKLDKKRTTLGIDVDANTAGAAAHIDAFVARQKLRNKIELDVDVDQGRLGALISRIGSAFASAGSAIASGFGKAFSGVSGLLGNLGEGFEQSAGQAGKIFGALSQLAQPLLVAVGYGTAFALAGAAVTAAWGIAATAIAAIPAAIGLVGAAAGTVMLGLDGIKKAAKSIQPEFDKLKKSVSDIFEKGLTPIFKDLATIFPKVQTSINGVASALVGTAFTVTQFITSARGVALLDTIFNNTAQAIRNMQPGIRDTIDGFLTLAAQGGVFQALTSAVNTFGAQFKKNLTDTLRDGSLAAAFRGFEEMLNQLAIGFSDLVKNGIEVFAGAAPGVNSFLKDLTGFFNRFDWKRLGTAVGGVFEGLGKALRDVPQGTIEDIEKAFDKLGDTFKDPKVQEGIKSLTPRLPPLINQLSGLIGPISEAVTELIVSWSKFDKADQKFRKFTDWWNGSNKDNNGNGILSSKAQWWQDLNDGLDGLMDPTAKKKWDDWSKWYNDNVKGPVQQSRRWWQ